LIKIQKIWRLKKRMFGTYYILKTSTPKISQRIEPPEGSIAKLIQILSGHV
jgi:hypothetical protein